MDDNTIHIKIYVPGESKDSSLVGLIQTSNGHLALVVNRHPCRQLGCDSIRGRIPHLVDRRIPFVAVAVPRHFSVDWSAVLGYRKLGKETSEIKSFAK